MQRFYQVVHARVKDGHQDAMLELRPRFVRAMQAAFPGLLDAHLVRLQDGTWLDIVSWASPQDAARAMAGHAAVPEGIEMDAHIAEILDVHQGDAVDHSARVA